MDLIAEAESAAERVRQFAPFQDGSQAQALEFMENVISNLEADVDGLRSDLGLDRE